MGTYIPHLPETKNLVLKLIDETELSAREIAETINKKYKHILDRKLTRCSVLSIKFKAGKCKPREYDYSAPKRVRKRGYIKSLAFNEQKEYISPHELSKQRLIAALRR